MGKKILKFSGNTTDGNPVMKNVFNLVGTHGVPLELILDKFKRGGWVVDWDDYIKSALKDGHNINTIKSRILSAVGDSYGSLYRKQFEYRLNNYA